MYICITTENFPDVMLFALNNNAACSLYFILFILVGVYFLMSVLLAVIFDNFKNRVETSQKDKIAERLEYIEYLFMKFDENDKGYLSMKETRQFFAHVLDLDYKKAKHRRLIYKIFRIVDPEDRKEVQKDNILKFFEISGFQIISKLAKEQMQLDAFNKQSEQQAGNPMIPDIIIESKSESSSSSDGSVNQKH